MTGKQVYYRKLTPARYVDVSYQLLLTTCGDMESAEKLAEVLLTRRLAACVTILPGGRSLYVWQGVMQRETEQVLLIKSRADRFEALRDALLTVHPYELPELIAVPIQTGLEAYLGWIDQQLELDQ